MKNGCSPASRTNLDTASASSVLEKTPMVAMLLAPLLLMDLMHNVLEVVQCRAALVLAGPKAPKAMRSPRTIGDARGRGGVAVERAGEDVKAGVALRIECPATLPSAKGCPPPKGCNGQTYLYWQ